MRNYKLTAIFVFLCLALVLGAQPKSANRKEMKCPAGNPEMPCLPGEINPRMMRRLGTIRKLRMLEELELTEEQENTFLPAITRFEKRRIELDSTFNVQMKSAHELIESGKYKESELKAKLETLKATKMELQQLEGDMIETISSILDTRQQILFIGFDKRFQAQMHKMLNKFMDNPRDKRRSPQKDDK